MIINLKFFILSEIVYWYKPTEVRDERTGDVRWKKKFEAEDCLQKSYTALERKFNASHKQIRDALITLERLGVVKRDFRDIETKLGKCPNVLYLELNPEALYRLTFTSVDDECADDAGADCESVGNVVPDHEGSDNKGTNKKVNTSPIESSSRETNEPDFAVTQQDEDMTTLPDDDVLTKKEARPAPTAHTNTKNTTKTKRADDEDGTQIDLLIERNDHVVNMCELKFYNKDFVVDKDYHRTLETRQGLLEEAIPRGMIVHSTLVTTYGLKYNEYSGDFDSVITMEDLFR